METDLKKIDSKELLSIYRLLLEYEEYLESDLNKMGEEQHEE